MLNPGPGNCWGPYSNNQMENCANSNLEVHVTSTRRPRFKAGSDLSSRVNRMAVDFHEDLGEDLERVEIKLVLSSEVCAGESGC